MSDDNRGKAGKHNDTWLTPKWIVDVLGPFDLDPCCPPVMPWRTAARMLSLDPLPPCFRPVGGAVICARGDGLKEPWLGRVFANFPYSKPLPWIERMAAHGDGILLGPGKSPDSKWGQAILATADAVFYPAGRFAFCLPDGTESKGKWNPHVFAAYGGRNVHALRRLMGHMPGVLLGRASL